MYLVVKVEGLDVGNAQQYIYIFFFYKNVLYIRLNAYVYMLVYMYICERFCACVCYFYLLYASNRFTKLKITSWLLLQVLANMTLFTSN